MQCGRIQNNLNRHNFLLSENIRAISENILELQYLSKWHYGCEKKQNVIKEKKKRDEKCISTWNVN